MSNFEFFGGRKKDRNEGRANQKKKETKRAVSSSFFLQENSREFFKGKKVSERICSLFALKKSCTRNAKILKVALV